MLMSKGITLLTKTDIFNDDIREWRRKPDNLKTWVKYNYFFHQTHQEQKRAVTTSVKCGCNATVKNIYGAPPPSTEEHHEAIEYMKKIMQGMRSQGYEVELEEPHLFLKDLKLNELEDLLMEVNAFCMLEKDAAQEIIGGIEAEDGSSENTVLLYWKSLQLVTRAEIQKLRASAQGMGADVKAKTKLEEEIKSMFDGQSKAALEKMKEEVEAKVKKCINAGGQPVMDENGGGVIDMKYWQTVLDELLIQLAKIELTTIHSKILVCQLEQLERRKEELANSTSNQKESSTEDIEEADAIQAEEYAKAAAAPTDVSPDFGDLEEELGLTNEIDLGESSYIWQERFRPRKPRYFNMVKTGYDWNKYNQTHYDHENPPPKTVQGYKFNIFYPDLIDRTQTPKYFLEPTNSKEFFILRFHAGPPYEDIAFKIINREWNKARKRGFKCTFERGVLSVYFNFKTHWYRK